MERLEGRVAVVTGAARGIGRATADLLAQHGCRLALVDVDESGLGQLAQELDARGVVTSEHVADVSDAERMQALVGEVTATHGGVHILVNNAGVSVLKRFEEHSLDDLYWLVGVNFWGVVYGCKFFLPELQKAEEAHIVNVSSMFGFVGVPGQSSYCATKFAVRGFTESLWAELRETRVGVTSIHPGGIRTEITETLRVTREEDRQRVAEAFDRHGHPPEDVARGILEGIQRKRLRVIVGREAYLAEWLKRLLPVRVHSWIARRMDPLEPA